MSSESMGNPPGGQPTPEPAPRPQQPGRSEDEAGASSPSAGGPVEKRLERMKGEIDALQVHLLKLERPWYTDGAVIVSGLALLFSFGTTWVSYQQAQKQERQQEASDARADLRTFILRLSALPKEYAELGDRYRGKPAVQGMLNGMLNQENALLAKQAAEAIRRLDSMDASVSSTEYMSVVNALSNSGLGDSSFLRLALETARDVNDEVYALRTNGGVSFSDGRLEDGRKYFRRALAIFDKYPTKNEFYKSSTHLLTEMHWADAEFAKAQCDSARAHMVEARRYAAALPPGPATESFVGQLDATASRLGECSG